MCIICRQFNFLESLSSLWEVSKSVHFRPHFNLITFCTHLRKKSEIILSREKKSFFEHVFAWRISTKRPLKLFPWQKLRLFVSMDISRNECGSQKERLTLTLGLSFNWSVCLLTQLHYLYYLNCAASGRKRTWFLICFQDRYDWISVVLERSDEKITTLCKCNSFTVRFVVTEASFLEFFRLIKKKSTPFTAEAKHANQLRVDFVSKAKRETCWCLCIWL